MKLISTPIAFLSLYSSSLSVICRLALSITSFLSVSFNSILVPSGNTSFPAVTVTLTTPVLFVYITLSSVYSTLQLAKLPLLSLSPAFKGTISMPAKIENTIASTKNTDIILLIFFSLISLTPFVNLPMISRLNSCHRQHIHYKVNPN